MIGKETVMTCCKELYSHIPGGAQSSEETRNWRKCANQL